MNGSSNNLNDSQGSIRIQHRVKHHNAASDRKKKIVRNLGKAEILVGIACLIIGIVVVVIAKTATSGYRTIGEGIWAPVFGIIAGVFGTLAGGKKSTGSKVNAHLGTGIVAALFAFILMCIDSQYSLGEQEDINPFYKYGVRILACLSCFLMILLIVSTTYACCMIDGCICCCDLERREMDVNTVDYSKNVRRSPFSRGPVQSQPGGQELRAKLNIA